MEKINGLNFQPWVGENYEKSKYGKLLLLGESHYLNNVNVDKSTADLTTEVVENAISERDGMKTPFFRTIEEIFSCENSNDFWNYVAFANLIQTGLTEAKSQPTEEDKESINPSFKILLENLKPEKVLILSKRMWNYWLTDDNAIKLSDANNTTWSEVWKYTYAGGECLVAGIKHPSRILGKQKEEWMPFIKKFLSLKP